MFHIAAPDAETGNGTWCGASLGCSRRGPVLGATNRLGLVGDVRSATLRPRSRPWHCHRVPSRLAQIGYRIVVGVRNIVRWYRTIGSRRVRIEPSPGVAPAIRSSIICRAVPMSTIKHR